MGKEKAFDWLLAALPRPHSGPYKRLKTPAFLG